MARLCGRSACVTRFGLVDGQQRAVPSQRRARRTEFVGLCRAKYGSDYRETREPLHTDQRHDTQMRLAAKSTLADNPAPVITSTMRTGKNSKAEGSSLGGQRAMRDGKRAWWQQL